MSVILASHETIRPPQIRLYDDEGCIDGFAGGGGTSAGIERVLGRSPDVAINHDPEALAMHEANHPETRHIPSNIRAVRYQTLLPGKRCGFAWFSPDCTYHSKARGGKPFRDRNRARRIRGLAWEAVRCAEAIHKYITGAGPFLGYALHQYHLMADAPNFADKPVRLFRTKRGIQFFGHVHEQPEQKPDEGIVPALELTDVKIIHLGYTIDAVRREKMLHRNLDLLKAEIASDTPRELAKVLVLRDYVNLAQIERERGSSKDVQYLRSAVRLFQREFADPTNRNHAIAWPFYQTALNALKAGVHVSWSFGAAPGALQGRPKGETFRAIDAAEMERIVSHRVRTWTDQLTPTPLHCDPSVTRNGDGGWGLLPSIHEDASEAVPV